MPFSPGIFRRIVEKRETSSTPEERGEAADLSAKEKAHIDLAWAERQDHEKYINAEIDRKKYAQRTVLLWAGRFGWLGIAYLFLGTVASVAFALDGARQDFRLLDIFAPAGFLLGVSAILLIAALGFPKLPKVGQIPWSSDGE